MKIGDAHSGELKLRRVSKKAAALADRLSLTPLFRRLGFGEPTPHPTMQEIKMLAPCVAGGKARRKGETVPVSDMDAAHLISLKMAVKVGSILNPKLQPWERPRPTPAPATARSAKGGKAA